MTSNGQRTLVDTLDDEAGVVQQFNVCRSRLSLTGQVVA